MSRNTNRNDDRYIKHNKKSKNNPYYISKSIRCKTVYYGSFPTLEEARMYRDYCEANDWDESLRLKKYDEELRYINRPTDTCNYQVSKLINGKRIYFGTCHTLEEAKELRDYCEANDWDIKCKQTCKDEYRHIHWRRKTGKYEIYKQVNGEYLYFGCYDDLQEAVYDRDLFEECDWDWEVIVNYDDKEE